MRLISPQSLRAWMDQRDKSLADLAKATERSRGFISHLRAGRRSTCSPRVAVEIARCLDVPLEALFLPSLSSDTGQDVKQRGKAA